MDLLKQCQEWHEADEYQKIIDALEAIPDEERTPELDSELARAYNNLANPGRPEGIEMLKKAIALLEPHEEYFEGDHFWNFRMGYAYYYLDQEGRALTYFRRALEARPGDDDTQMFLDDCEKRITLPHFAKTFRQRTAEAWKAFSEREAELRRIMDEDKTHQRGEELVGQCEAILRLAFDDVSFEMGFNGEKHELILTPEGDKVKLFELVYFQKHAPQKVLERWNILVGRQPVKNIGLRTNDGWSLSGEEVQIWLGERGKHSFALSAYCPKLLPMLREEEGRVWWMLTTLTDQVLGEIPHMRYIDDFEVLERPREEASILLSNLPERLKDMGLDLSTDPESYLDTYTGYQIEPDENPDADWRMDILFGSTCCPPLINAYLNHDNAFMDDLHADGAVAGFFCYPLDSFTGKERSQQIFDFRDKVEGALAAGDGPEALTLTGGATGLYCGYVDFIAWDLRTALTTAKAFFEHTDLPWASFHVFRREAATVPLKAPEEASKENEGEWEDGDETQSDHKGTFGGFVLLSQDQWDKEQFIRDMKEKWDITVEEDEDEDTSDDAVVFQVGDMIAAVSLMPYPIPDGEAEVNAENNYMWPEAVEVAKAHSAHIMVGVLGKEEDVLEKGKLYTKLVAACCRQPYATGVYTSGVVFEPRFYEGFADMMQEGELPIFNWIWFGLYRDENGMNAYTYGMDVLGKDEMEVLGTDAEPGELRDFLASLVSYVLENDVVLHDGETIGFSADDKHTITRSKGAALPGMTLKVSYAPTEGGPDDKGDGSGQPEVYTEEEMEAVEAHIQQYFGKFEQVFHELVSPDIHVDICVVPPTEERNYYTLVTMGMGAHRMNVPEELEEYKLERAELAIALPADWKVTYEAFKDETWYWPVRLLKELARLPIQSNTWLGWGHTVDHQEPFAEHTQLCASILTNPQNGEDGGEVCALPGGEEVNFYQVIPLYRDELEYKLEHTADDLLERMGDISFVARPDRRDVMTGESDQEDDGELWDDPGELDDGAWHLDTIEEKNLPVDEINVYNHMAIYLRWCMEHDLMDKDFLEEYGQVVKQVKAHPAGVDLRAFIRDELDGQLTASLFHKKGQAFARYYYGENDSPYFPCDIDSYAIAVIGQERNYSDEIQDEAYLFLPFDEEYYQAMAKVISRRFVNWQGQRIDEDTLEPSELAEAMMDYLDCDCTYFPSMKDDDPIMSAYSYAKRDGAHQGFVPVLIKVDEILWECLVMNSDPDSDGADDYAFHPDKVAEYREKLLSAPIPDGKAVLEELIGQRKAEAEEDGADWEEEILGEMEGGCDNNRFSSYWNDDTQMTYPLILAKIPVKNPWEIFAWLPFGNWNECPDTPELMAAAKYWFEQHGAAPAAMTHDELEFDLPAPVPQEKAMEAAVEQYGFCPDVVDQGPEGATVGALADVLRQSTVWYFWWD